MSYGFHEIFRRIVIKWRTCMVKVLLHNADGYLPSKLGRDALHFYLCHQNWAVTRYTVICHQNLDVPRHNPNWAIENVPYRATFQSLPPKLGREALHFCLCHQNWATTRYTPFSATEIWLCCATVPSGPPKLRRAALHSHHHLIPSTPAQHINSSNNTSCHTL